MNNTTTIEFSRPNKSVPWGFSIQGGKEFGCPLSVLKVTSGSIANRLGVVAGDFIIKINELPTDVMTHQQAIIQIQNLNVKLEIKRTDFVNDNMAFPPPPSIDISNFNNSCRISTSIGELPPPPPELVRVHPSAPPPNPQTSSYSYPPPKQPIKEPQPYVITKPKDTYQLPVAVPTIPFDHLENNKSKNVPTVVLDSKKLEQFQQQINDSKTSELSMNLGKMLQNQPRESKDRVVQLSSEPKDQARVNKNSTICHVCKGEVLGAYIEANNKIYCKNHFTCTFCGQLIKGNQFIETKEGILYCMEDFQNNIAPKCNRCHTPVVQEQTVALGKIWHPGCFVCDHCKQPINQSQFHVKEDNGVTSVFCERDYKEHYEIKCSACKFPIDNDDRYLLVAGKNYHVDCYKR